MFNNINRINTIILILIIKIFALCFSLFIFNKFSPLIDSNHYINHFYEGTNEFRTRVIQEIVIFFSFFNEIIIHFIFSCISIIGFLYSTIKHKLKPIYLLFLLLPSSLVWTSIVGKEAIFFGFFTLLLFIWGDVIKNKCNLLDIILIILSFIVCSVLRPHYMVCILWLYFSILIIKNFYNYKNIILFLSFFGLFSICFTIIYSDFFRDSLLLRALSSIEYYSRASRFIDYDILQPQIATKLGCCYDEIIGNFKEALIKHWMYSIIGPRLDEIFVRIEFLPFFIEGIFILFFSFAFYLYAVIKKIDDFKYFNLLFIYCLIPSLILIILVHAPFGILNPGTGIRWRVNFEAIFYLTPLLIFFNYKYLKIN